MELSSKYPRNGKPLQSIQTMDYESFATTLKYLLDAAWGEGWGTFTEEGPSDTDPRNVKYPMITYSLDNLQPGQIGKNTREIKPRIRHVDFQERNGTQPPITAVYGQVFHGELVLEVWEESNAKVNELAKRLRQTISIYTGFLKERGLKELIFQSMRKETSVIRDSCKGRELRYLIGFEEITEVPSDVFRVFEVVDEKLQTTLGF